jgi:hypothetical protein
LGVSSLDLGRWFDRRPVFLPKPLFVFVHCIRHRLAIDYCGQLLGRSKADNATCRNNCLNADLRIPTDAFLLIVQFEFAKRS